jgi:MIP family channel proteins
MKQVPALLRQFLAELLGTFLLVVFGDGSIAQYAFLDPPHKSFLSVCFGYGFGLMIGILVSGNVSGGHLNPAVTLALACVKKCKWICVPVYWAAQYLGAFLGAAVLYGVYADGIDNNGGKTVANAGIFASYPNDVGTLTQVADQVFGTALLLVIILAVTDKRNMNVSSGLIPLLIGLGLAAIHISFAYNAGCAINPARDFSPRLLTLVAGFGGEVFTKANSFFWIPWVMPHVGGILGALVYFFMVEVHHPDVDEI